MNARGLRPITEPGNGRLAAGFSGSVERGGSVLAGRSGTRLLSLIGLAGIAVAAAGCQSEDAPPPPVRMVRTVTVQALPPVADTSFTGHIEAQDQAALSFRIAGRLAEREVAVGATVKEGQIVARLDPENELNELRSAQAALTAAQGQLRKAENQLQRQTHLLARNITSQADFEAAEQGRRASQAQVDAAQARVHTAQDVVGFTTLKADAPGVVTRIGAEPGEVVPAGRMIAQLARREGRDAVFEVPADRVRALQPDARVYVALTGAVPPAPVPGRVREVAPQADPVTRTFRVRVGLADPPASFRLGTAVTGTIRSAQASAIAIPAAALTRRGSETGVWIVDPTALTVSLRKLDVLDRDPATALIGKGLAFGDIVVTAGAGLLKDGQRVRLAGAETQ